MVLFLLLLLLLNLELELVMASEKADEVFFSYLIKVLRGKMTIKFRFTMAGHENHIGHDPFRPHSPGFRLMFDRNRKFSRYFDTLRLDPQLIRAFSRERVHQLGVSSTAACDSLQIARPRILNSGLYTPRL